MKSRYSFIIRWSLWCAVCVLISLTNMNYWEVSELQRAGLNFILMLNGNILWLWQVSAGQERERVYSRMIIWNASYTLITFLVPPLFLGVRVDSGLLIGSALLAVGLVLFSNSNRISRIITQR